MNLTNSDVYILRKMYRLPLERFATLIGTDKAHINRIERGERTLTKDMAERIANIFELTENKMAKIRFDYEDYAVERQFAEQKANVNLGGEKTD